VKYGVKQQLCYLWAGILTTHVPWVDPAWDIKDLNDFKSLCVIICIIRHACEAILKDVQLTEVRALQ
jgi:hypothetical protein